MKMVRLTEVLHQWEGKAIARVEGALTEINLGVVTTDKKLKETGVKELFMQTSVKDLLKENEILVAIEVEKNVDIITTYEMDSEEFKKLAKVVETPIEITEEVAAE